MRLPTSPADIALLSIVFFRFVGAAHDCSLVVVDRQPFDLSKLGGPQSALDSEQHGVTFTNTTYTIDICRPLGRVSDIPKDEQCPGGTRVCAIERLIKPEEEIDTVTKVLPIAGELKGKGGDHMDEKWSLLSTSPASSDAGKEGLRLIMNGGYDKDRKRAQRAVVEFLCDKTRDGLEYNWSPEDKYDDNAAEDRRRDEKNSGDEEAEPEPVDDENGPSLRFISYETDKGDVDTLHLTWRTRYACEGSKDEQDSSDSHWGFFTWFIIIIFLSTAAYLIFGSWLNYNRYGARGWDLLPHSDTIRDIPYLLRDWLRKVVNTLQGGGSRGGYAAV